MRGAGAAKAIVSLTEAQAFVRVETGEEEAILAGLLRTASALCESFLNQVVIDREFVEQLPASPNWERLSVSPVRTIASVEAVDETGATTALMPAAYAIDIDGSGDGWVRLTRTGAARRLRVSGRAGLAEDQNGVPEPIRQGVIRLVAHLYASRDGAAGEVPAAVTALWRPYRRMRIA